MQEYFLVTDNTDDPLFGIRMKAAVEPFFQPGNELAHLDLRNKAAIVKTLKSVQNLA
jgi:hypothetical protein